MKQIDVELVKYKTPTDLTISYFKNYHPNMSKKDILNLKVPFVFHVKDKVYRNIKVPKFIELIKKLKMWAFCRCISKTKKSIHYWFDRRVGSSNAIELFAHEFTHAFGESSEKRAEITGAIAKIAYKIVSRNIKRKMML